MRNDLFFEAKRQRETAWGEKDFDKSQKLRAKEQENYEKYMLVNGLMKAIEKGKKKDDKK